MAKERKVGWSQWLSEPVAVFTLAIAAFTLGLFVAALWQVWISRSSAEQQLRAYVTLTDGHVQLINDGKAVEIGVTFRNSGQTPGDKFSTWASFRVGPPGEEPWTEAPPPEERGGTSIIGSGQTAAITLRANLAPQHTLASLQSGENIVYVWGRADYEDAFGEPRHFVFRSVNGTQVRADAWQVSPHKSGYEAN